ncbi:MAG: hypothetical protein VX938_11775, partial [Myxococcota bacterium]|nr:hypothetical protein [Myxococcota bacterium]
IRDIAAIGDVQYHGQSTYDEGGNSGWFIEAPEPKDYFWVGGSGNWSDVAHWSNESGGEPAECLRGASDNVYFDENSFAEGSSTVTLDLPESTCHNMDWTGAQFEPVFTGGTDHELVITGDLTLEEGLIWAAPGQLWLRGSGERTLSADGVTCGSYGIHGDAEGGSGGLADSLSLPNGYFHVDEGGLNTNGHDVHVRRFISNNSNVRSIDLEDSQITLDQYWFMQDTTNLTFDAGTSTILWNAGNTLSFDGGGETFHILQATISSGAGYLRGDPTFKQVTKLGGGILRVEDGVTVDETLHVAEGTLTLFSDSQIETLAPEPGVTMSLGDSAVQTVGSLLGDGTCSQLIRLESTDNIGKAILSVSEGEVAVSHYQIRNIEAVGGATFTAASSLDTGGNVGWSILPSEPVDYYWIGGTGSWGDGAHWAHESGGASTGCAPSFQDGAIFDEASFPETGGTLTLDLPLAECHHMTWTGVQNAPNVQGGNDQHLTIYGNLVLNSAMSWSAVGDIRLEGPGEKLLDPQGVQLGSYALRLDDEDASWTLASELSLNQGYLFLEHGGLDTAG